MLKITPQKYSHPANDDLEKQFPPYPLATSSRADTGAIVSVCLELRRTLSTIGPQNCVPSVEFRGGNLIRLREVRAGVAARGFSVFVTITNDASLCWTWC